MFHQRPFIIYAPKRHKPHNTWQIEIRECLVTWKATGTVHLFMPSRTGASMPHWPGARPRNTSTCTYEVAGDLV